MTDQERQALIEAGALTEEIEAQLDTVDETVEQLARMSIVDEERHDEIVEGITSCRERLEALSTRTNQESPLLNQLLTELTELRAELATIRVTVDKLSSNPPQLESVAIVTEVPSETVPVESTVEPVREEPQEHAPEPAEPVRRRRIF